MGIGDGYVPEEQTTISIKAGDHIVKITSAIEKVSSNGNPMVELQMITKESPIVFKYWLVKNEHFNMNATRLFDCFKIQRGNFDLRTWIGKKGLAFIDKGKPKDDGKSYFEIRYLLNEAREAPVEKARTDFEKKYESKEPASSDEFSDDIPF